MRVLLVDDEGAVLDLLARVCTRDGHDVVCAASAGEALAELREKPFDLLLTDIVMPDLDGLALVRRAKSMQPEIMPIVITGYERRYSLEDVLEAGASDLILKPVRIPELRARLKLADDQRRLIAQLKAQGRALQNTSSQMIHGLKRELDEARQTVARLAEVVARGDRTI